MKTPINKLISPDLRQLFAEHGMQYDAYDRIVVAKFFNPCGSQTWYAFDYDDETNTCEGFVTGMVEDEISQFSIDELEAVILPFGLRIERDLYFQPCALSTIKSEPS